MRKCGILMPIFSLPSNYGIGTLGKKAYNFIDFLKKAGQSYWQILPLNPTNYGDSPYQSFSSFAGNPYFIDIDFLIDEGLLTFDEASSFDFGDNAERVDYEKLYKNRINLLKIAFKRFVPDCDFLSFCEENSVWLDDYALFMCIKDDIKLSFNEWDYSLKHREKNAINNYLANNINEINFYKFIQYKFFKQWFSLKEYANQNGIKIIGDIPIYVALDSADIWASPEQFQLDDELYPTFVAGCPPDAFSPDGQLWGNPLYDWDYMKKDNYSWWKKRVAHSLKLYDIIRIDHFRGFESFYAIPYEDETAENGFWVKGPDIDLFHSFEDEFGENLPIIAENLGYLTPEVHRLLKDSGFAGMSVLQFAFNGELDNIYLPHNCEKNRVIYIGTHDNDTTLGWLKSGDKDEIRFAKEYLNIRSDNDFLWSMIKTALMSVAKTCILTMPDLIGLDSVGRINTPATLGNNWVWRIKEECINDWLANIIKENTIRYSRYNENL